MIVASSVGRNSQLHGKALLPLFSALAGLGAPHWVLADDAPAAEAEPAAAEAVAPPPEATTTEPAPKAPALPASPEQSPNNATAPVVSPEAEAAAVMSPPPRHRHAIGLRLGPRSTTVREDLLVPLTFSGGGPDLGASYRGLLGPGLLDARFDMGAAVVSNRFEQLGFTIHHSLAAAYRLPLPGSGAWRFALGPVLGENVDSLALKMWDDAHNYWLGLVWLGPSASLRGPLAANWQLHATAELALVGTVGRPPAVRHNKQDPTQRLSYYLFHPFADSSFFAPWDVQLLRFDVAARWTGSDDRVGRGWSFGCQGRFSRASEPATILVFEAVLYAAWTWGL